MHFPDKLRELIQGGQKLADALKIAAEVYRNDTWGTDNLDDLAVTPGKLSTGQYGGDYIKITDTKAANTSGGTFTSGAWQTRVLTTEDSDTGSNAKLTYALDYDAQTSNFTVGNTVTGGTSSATGTIAADVDAGTTGTLYVIDVSGTFQDNETITDATGSATSNIPSGLIGNGFQLLAGTYNIYATAPAYIVDSHKAKLYNITDTSDEIIGSSEYCGAASTVQNSSIITGEFTITASKVFEIQHRCQTTRATNGFGVASNFSVSEIYTTVELKKVK